MKTLIRLFIKSVLIFLLVSCSNNNAPIVTTINNPTLLNAAKSLSAQGKLEVAEDGFVYLKVSDDYLNVLYPIVVRYADTKDAPCIVPASNDIGSHITLFYAGDLGPDEIKSLPIDKTFNFQVKEVEMITTKKRWHQKLEKIIWYVVTIDSPTLSSSIKPLTMNRRYRRSLHISIAREIFNTGGFCIKRRVSY
jgi:hypothetical protein